MGSEPMPILDHNGDQAIALPAGEVFEAQVPTVKFEKGWFYDL